MNVAGLIQILATLSWIAFFGLIVIAVVQASRGRGIKGATPFVLVFLVLAIILTVIGAGLVFIPFVEQVVRYPISKQTYTMSVAPLEGQVQGDDSIAARTSDGQEIFVDASVLYAIDPKQVVQIHITWQNRYTDELVRPSARGIVRDAVSQYGVEEVVTTKRDEMEKAITDAMTEKFAENGLILYDFILRNITFSPEYAASVEQKQIAEQQAKQAAFVVEQRRQEAQQAVETAKGQAESVKIKAQGEADARLIQADAEAKALQMIADALAGNTDLLTYQYILKLAPGIQVMLVPNNAPYLLPLPTLEPTPTPEAGSQPAPH